jgi:cyclopropane fatty-acyl-phospholipid synthase-like methyltransferase
MADIRSRLYKKYVSGFKGDVYKKMNNEMFQVKKINARFGDYLKPYKNAKILELGCGAGFLLKYLKTEGFTDFVGVDVSGEQIAIAKREELPAIEADASNFLTNHPNTFDVVIAIDFIEHFTKDEIFSIIGKIKSSLSSNGLVIFQTPNGAGWMPGRIVWGDLTHMTIFTPGSINQLLKLFGFKEVKFKETGPFPGGLYRWLRIIGWNIFKLLLQFLKFLETGSGQKIWTKSFICSAHKPDYEKI